MANFKIEEINVKFVFIFNTNVYMFFQIFILLNSFLLVADEDQNLSTPYNTVYTHLEYLQDENFHPEISALSFNVKDKDQAVKLAIKLKRYLDAKGLFIEMDRLSNNPNYTDTVTGRQIFRLIQYNKDIYVEKIDSNWYYSKHTVKLIPELYKSIFPTGFKTILLNMPEIMFTKILGLELWKMIGIFIYLIISLVLFLIFKKIVRSYVLRILERFNKEIIISEPVGRSSGPISLLIVLILLDNSLPYLQLSIDLSKVINTIIHVIYPVLTTLIAYRITDVISGVFERIASKTETTTDDQLIPLVSKAIKVVVIVIGSFYIVDSTGVDYTPLLAGASIGGLALALAAQDTVKNFFGSVTIFTDKPFEVGDWITFGGSEGTVEEVGIRSTRVRTFYNSLVSIPNGKISDMTIDNMGRRVYRRYTTKLNLRYDTPIETAKEYVSKIRELVLKQEGTRKDYFEIHINDISESSIQILVYIFFEVSDWTGELQERQKFIVSIVELAKSLGIEFAYPTQVIKLEQDYKSNELNNNTNKDINE